MPRVHTIPSHFYGEPKSLFLYLYRKVFFEHILLATNNRLRIKVPDAELITMSELQQYFAVDHLAHPNFIKSAHVEFNTWFSKLKEHAKLYCGKTLNLTLTRSRFYLIAKYLEVGINIGMVDRKVKQGSKLVTKVKNGHPVKIHNLNDKIDPLIDNLNKTWIKFKNPGPDRVFCLDESFRKTYSPLDQFMSYLPSKPDRYGQKYQALVDEDFYLHKLSFDHCKQFARWHGTKELVDFMIPDEYKFLGCTIVADNFYNTGESLLMLHSQGTSLLGTMRRNSTGKIMGHQMVQTLTKLASKKNFRRKIEIFEQKLNVETYGQSQYIQLGFFHDKPGNKVVTMCTNDPRLFNSPDQGHVSRYLGPTEKPEMIRFYNKNKCFVDEMDRQLSSYTCARAFKNCNPIRRFISNIWDFCFNNAFILFRKHYQLQLNHDSKYAKLDREGRLRSQFYFDVLFGLIGFEPELPEMPINLHSLPNCGPHPTRDCEITVPPHEKRARTQYKCATCQKYICKRDQMVLCPSCYIEKIQSQNNSQSE